MAHKQGSRDSIKAGKNALKIDTESLTAGRDVVINAGQNGDGKRPRRSNVPPLSSTFIERKGLTKKIDEALNGDERTGVLRQAAARAYGGYGKTVAAILYAHEYEKSYPGGRFFLSVENAEPVTALASLAAYIGVDVDLKPQEAAAAVKAELEGDGEANGAGGASLLILDNLTGREQWDAWVKGGFVPRGRCRVLITTRAESIPHAESVSVGRLTKEEAREVYRRFCEKRRTRDTDPPALPDDATADALTELVGGLAVAVAAIAARMKLAPETDWRAYADKLRSVPVSKLADTKSAVRDELGHNGAPLAEATCTVFAIDDAFDSLPAPEKRAVEYAALLPEDMVPGIWLGWLLDHDAKLPPTLDDSTPNPNRIELPTDDDLPDSPIPRILRHLDDLDLLTPKAEDGKLLGLHRLWRSRLRERLSVDADHRDRRMMSIIACAQSRHVALVGKTIEHPTAIASKNLRWELTPIATVVSTLWSEKRLTAASSIGVWVAVICCQTGRFNEASGCLRPLLSHVDAVREQIGDSPTAACLNNLSGILQDLGDLAGAELSIQKALDIELTHLPPDHPTLATTWSNLGVIQLLRGQPGEARKSIHKALLIELKHVESDDPTLATTWSNLAMIQLELGELTEAGQSLLQAIDICEKHFESNHLNLANIWSNLASIQQVQDNLVGARISIEKSINIELEHFGPDHPTLATSLSNLAIIQKKQGDLIGARQSILRAIEIYLMHFSDDHPTLATMWSNLAMILQDLNDLEGAHQHIQRAIEIELKHFAPEHPDLAVSWINLASICHAKGDRAAAAENFRKALRILLTHFDENHPHVKSVRESMKYGGYTE